MIFHFDKFRRGTGFRFIKGCRASCERKLREGFEETERGFIANVSVENIDPLMRDYIAAQTAEPTAQKLPICFRLDHVLLNQQHHLLPQSSRGF